MKATKLLTLLKDTVERFDLDFGVLANVGGTIVCTTNDGELKEFLSLYNASFFDSAAILGLYENLKVSVLPQMAAQADKFCYLGFLNDRYIYGVFGKTDKTVGEQYFLSKEIDKFLHAEA